MVPGAVVPVPVVPGSDVSGSVVPEPVDVSPVVAGSSPDTAPPSAPATGPVLPSAWPPAPEQAWAAQPPPPFGSAIAQPAAGANFIATPTPPPGSWGDAPQLEPEKSSRLGLVAMIVALAVLILSLIASVVVGTSIGPYSTRSGSSFTFNTGSLTPEQIKAIGPIGVLMIVQIGLGTILGVWALVQGIVAVVKRRGRKYGIIAIVVAGLAPLLSLLVYGVGIFATLPK